MVRDQREIPVRDRLLLAGVQLLEKAGGGDVSTRAVCDLAGVQAPTLYHHFGSKEGLLDAVVSHGFRQFLAARRDQASASADPIEEIRQGWDIHVEFGLQHPASYAHIYGRVERGKRCGVVAEVEAMLLQALAPAARQGRLAVTPADAAAEVLAASSGVILTLITQPEDAVDPGLSTRVRDAILDSITTGSTSPVSSGGEVTTASAAIALASTLEDAPTVLNDAETALLRDWLGRIASPASSGARI
ncbi:TetR/AcrR family transcriptional regulator [Planotetraspora sp. GP83]|uniref:TetR/AcrR family transcriptional regulator n=1 Tax=Planotetraspora sp. GP83 TaxID=3156264 RepID=UPI003512EDFC